MTDITRRRALPRATEPAVGILIALMLLATPLVSSDEGIRLQVSTERVGRYETIELALEVGETFENPFDPDEVDAYLVVTPPSGKSVRLPAFYMQDFEHRRRTRAGRVRDWLYPVGEGSWRARFAPVETGEHQVVARIRTRSGRRASAAVRLQSLPSERRGFVRASRTDPRFFEFSEGGPFFAVGQNLAFIGESQYATLSRIEEILEKLSKNGANYLRIWTCCHDWAMAIEAEKSAWGRSWGGRRPIVLLPDSEPQSGARRCVKIEGEDGFVLAVAPSHPVALRPECRYVASGKLRTDGAVGVVLEIGGLLRETLATPAGGSRWQSFRHEFRTGPEEFWLPRTTLRLAGKGTAWLDGLSLREVEGGSELLWEADVNRPVPGTYNQVDSFLLDRVVAAAERNGIYLQLCLITRDLYMSSLADTDSAAYEKATRDAKNLLRYAVARWGSSTSVVTWEYFNEMDPSRPTGPFYAALGEYLEEIDPYRHLRATSTWHPSPRDWKHPKLDVADEHFYVRPVKNPKYADEVAAVLGCAKFLRDNTPSKPALLSEFGLATERWGLSPRMKRDEKLVHVHNALWASALSGLSGTAMFWWWEELDRLDVYPRYRAVAAFVADIPYTSGELEPIVAPASLDRIRVVGLRGKNRAYLWIFDTEAAWVGKGLEGAVPEEVTGLVVKPVGLADRAYHVPWWDTHKATILREDEISAGSGPLRLSVPAFTRDVACQVLPR